MLVQRKGCSAQIAKEDLEQIDLALFRFHDVFSGTLAQFMPSQGKTVKYHKTSHITSTIRRFGHIKHVSSQTYEHEHVPLKKAVRATNMQSSGHASSF